MRIEGYKKMRAGDVKGRGYIHPKQSLKRHILIFFNHTKLVHHSFSEGGFERRKK